MNRDGLDQVSSVLMRQGGQEIHVMELPIILESFAAGGDFHLDMILAPVDDRKTWSTRST